MNRRLTHGCIRVLPLALIALAGPASGQIRTEEFKSAPATLRPFDLFGSSVALSGNRLFAGVYGEADPLSGFPASGRPGKVLLLDATTGQTLAQLTANDAKPDDGFGFSAAADGARALIGSIGSDGNAASTGAAYLLDAQTGQQLSKLTAADGDAFDLFGGSAGLDGTHAIVGARHDSDVAPRAGSAYLFDAATGQQRFKLQASIPAAENQFGFSVAVDGPFAAVGAPGFLAAGSVHVFDTATGQHLLQLAPAAPQAGELFGNSVAVDGAHVLVGAPLASGSSQPTPALGSVYVFDAVTGLQLSVLRPDPQSAALGFGRALSVDTGRVAISALGANVAGYYNGSVHVFDIASGQLVTELVASDAPAASFSDPFFVGGPNGFGRSVAYGGGRVAVGAYTDSQRARYAGAVYVFGDATVNTGQGHCYADGLGASCPCGFDSPSSGCANSEAPGALLYGTGDAVLANDTLTLRVANLPAGVFGLFFQGTAQGVLPAGEGLLCTNGAIRYPVQMASASGKLSRTGFSAQATPGAALSYQLWYRDPSNFCALSGFNFSNAWSVSW